MQDHRRGSLSLIRNESCKAQFYKFQEYVFVINCVFVINGNKMVQTKLKLKSVLCESHARPKPLVVAVKARKAEAWIHAARGEWVQLRRDGVTASVTAPVIASREVVRGYKRRASICRVKQEHRPSRKRMLAKPAVVLTPAGPSPTIRRKIRSFAASICLSRAPRRIPAWSGRHRPGRRGAGRFHDAKP